MVDVTMEGWIAVTDSYPEQDLEVEATNGNKIYRLRMIQWLWYSLLYPNSWKKFKFAEMKIIGVILLNGRMEKLKQ